MKSKSLPTSVAQGKWLTPAQRWRQDVCEYFRQFMALHVARDKRQPGRVTINDLTSADMPRRTVNAHLAGRQQPDVESALNYARVMYGGEPHSAKSLESVKYPWCHALTLWFVTGHLDQFVFGAIDFAEKSPISVHRLTKTWKLVHAMPFLCDRGLNDTDNRVRKAFLMTDGGDLNDAQRALIYDHLREAYPTDVQDIPENLAELWQQFIKIFTHREWAKFDASLSLEEQAEFAVSIDRSPTGSMERAAWNLALDTELSLRFRQRSVCNMLCNQFSARLADFENARVRSRYMDSVWGPNWQGL